MSDEVLLAFVPLIAALIAFLRACKIRGAFNYQHGEVVEDYSPAKLV